MNRMLRTCSVLLLLCAASAHAELYKWVGPDGKVTYSDTPPPKAAARVETKSNTPGATDTTGLPYELAQAVKNHPVTLYTGKDCAACDEGRKLLSGRGIPFTEKTVTSDEDAKQLRQAGGDGTLPLLTIGRAKEIGFEAGAWNRSLTVGGYPETSKLPKNYRNPVATAAAPAPRPAVPRPAVPRQQVADESRRVTAESAATDLPPAIGNAPPGFRF